MTPREEIDKLKEEMSNCQTSVYSRIEAIENELKTQSLQLKQQAVQRADFNSDMTRKLDAVITRFDDHDTEEMKKYDKIIERLCDVVEALEALSAKTESIEEATNGNSDFINMLKKYWVRISFVTIGVGGTIGIGYWLYNFLTKHGMVIIFEKVA